MRAILTASLARMRIAKHELVVSVRIQCQDKERQRRRFAGAVEVSALAGFLIQLLPGALFFEFT
ncbi:MAG: hypothetical protein WB973_20065, partial [Thermoanaerobaculia bacterium]